MKNPNQSAVFKQNQNKQEPRAKSKQKIKNQKYEQNI